MTKTQPTHKKLPRGKLAFCAPAKIALHEFLLLSEYAKGKFDNCPVAVIPCHTPAQARQIVKAAEFLRLPVERKRYELAVALAAHAMGLPSLSEAGFKGLKPKLIVGYINQADALLAAMGMGGAK